MYKTISLVTAVILLAGCSANMAEPNNKEPASEETFDQRKHQSELVKQANKVKCQDARMDMVDAEAKGNVGEIQLVKARLQKFCVAED